MSRNHKKSLADALESAFPDSLTQQLSDRRTVEQLNSATVEQLNSRTVQPLNGATVQQQHSTTVIPLHSTTAEQYNSATVQQHNGTTVEPVNSSCLNPLGRKLLTDFQFKVLNYMASLPGKRTSRHEIAEHLGTALTNSRDAVARLAKKGFIGNVTTEKSKVFQGFSYVLNEPFCQQIGIELSDRGTVEQLNSRIAHSSSSDSLLESTTTTKDCPTVGQSDSEHFVLTGPEMGYWIEGGVTERQALAWCKEFEVTPEELRQQLAWLRFDLLNGKEAEIKKDLVSFTYGIFKRTACSYARPAGYRTPAEIRRDNLKAQIEADEKAREEMEELKKVATWNDIINDPQGTEYQRIYQSLTTYEKSLTGKMLNAAMKKHWEAGL